MILPPPALLALGLVLALLVLLPARRLQLAGLSSRLIGMYAAGLWILAFFVAVRPFMLRFLLPILLIAYLAPFVVAPERIGRVVRRARRGGDEPPRPPMKNITPPDGPTGPA